MADFTVTENPNLELGPIEPLFYPAECDRRESMKLYEAFTRKHRMKPMEERIMALEDPGRQDIGLIALLLLNGFIEEKQVVAKTAHREDLGAEWAFVLMFLAVMQAITPQGLHQILRNFFWESAREHERIVQKHLAAMTPHTFFVSVYGENPICAPDNIFWAVALGLMPGCWLIRLHQIGHIGTPKQQIAFGEQLVEVIEHHLAKGNRAKLEAVKPPKE